MREVEIGRLGSASEQRSDAAGNLDNRGRGSAPKINEGDASQSNANVLVC